MKMWKKALSVILAILFLVLIRTPVWAQDVSGLFGMGARVSYFNTFDTDLAVFDIEFDDSTLYGLNLVYFFNTYFSLELGIEHSKNDVNVSGNGLSDFYFGDVTQIPILLTARFHLPIHSRVTPYLGGGAGFYSNDFDLSQVLFGGATFEPKSSIGYHVNGGVEFFVSERIAFNLDFKYIWNTVEFDATGVIVAVGVPATSDIDLDAFYGGFGIRYYFK
ncbi:OmpW family protein [Thermodesulfobacteriota bacterium]